MSNWISVNLKMPPKSKSNGNSSISVLVCDKYGRVGCGFVKASGGLRFWSSTKGDQISGVTHWMEFPIAPIEAS